MALERRESEGGVICPGCKTDLEGGLIFDTMMGQYGEEARALDAAASYGATKTSGRWDRAIGIYSLEEDRTIGWKCPDCKHEWGRK